MSKKKLSKEFAKMGQEMIDYITISAQKALVDSVNKIMLQTADDYEEIYQKCVKKFYSIRAPKKYIRHGMGSSGVKKGINLYRATISKYDTTTWHGNLLISQLDIDRDLYENEYMNTDAMGGYTSLFGGSSTEKGGYVDPYIIVSNMMHGMRWYPNSVIKGNNMWSVGKLSIKTSIGNVSGGGTPIDLISVYEDKWDKTKMERLAPLFKTNFNRYFKEAK